MSAAQTPLLDLLDRVPDDIVLGIPGDEPMFPSYTNIPIGKMAQEAAAELRRLYEVETLYRAAMRGRHAMSEELLAVERQRDALLEALKMVRKTVEENEQGVSGEANYTYSYKVWTEAVREAIAAAEENRND